jgi:hypothetical protein
MKPTLAREIVLDALVMAIWRRKPEDRVLVTRIRDRSTVATTGSTSVGITISSRA